GDQEEIAWCLWVLTDCVAFGDDRDYALAIAEASLAQRRALGDEFYIAHALIGVCEFYWSFQMERVLECTQESADIRRRLGDMQGLCFSLTFLGEWQLLDGHLREADLYFDEGIALQEAHGKSQFYVRLIADKAKLAFWRGEFEAATRLLEIGMDFARDQ